VALGHRSLPSRQAGRIKTRLIKKDTEAIEMLSLAAARSRNSVSVVCGNWVLDWLRILEQTIERR